MERPVFVVFIRKNIFRAAVFLLFIFIIAAFGLQGISILCFGSANSLRSKKIVIDPGHGGIDGGTNCSDFMEKEINLVIAKKLGQELTKYGTKVIFTREHDVDLDQLNSISSSRHKRDLHARVSIIEENKPDVFLSIHVNANHRKPSTNGSMVFFNKKILNADKLAGALQNNLNRVLEKHDLKKHSAKPAEFYILRNSTYKGAMIELGFMTNPREKELLKQDQYQWELTKGIVEGLKEYFSAQNRKNVTINQEKAERKDEAKEASVKLYFPSKITDRLDWELLNGKLVSNTSDTTERLVRETVTALIKGPQSRNLLPVVDPRVQIRSLIINNGIVEIDFSKEIKNIPHEHFAEYLVVNSLVETITQFRGIRGVKFLIEGEQADILLGDIDLSKVLTPEKPRAVISLVIDDLAGGETGRKEIMSIQRPLTLAVLPRRELSSEIAQEAFQKGFQVFLHIPMEPEQGNPAWLGYGAITTRMSLQDIRKTLLDDLEDIPHATGINNHMGSKVTKREDIMREILSVAKEKNLLILDSRTTEDTVIPKIARELELPMVERTLFLDEINSVEHIKNQIRKLAEISVEKGSAVGIGHVGITGKNTARGIREMISWLEDQGIELVFISKLFE